MLLQVLQTRLRVRRSPGAVQRALLVLSLLAATATPALASPGAHGPNGEHLDAPSGQISTGIGVPRFETQSDLFELVGTLNPGEMTVFINRFATNEPVLGASVELESGDLSAAAVFHEDMGVYALTDPALVKALGEPGDHALVITVIAGADADLLDATMHVAPEVAHSGVSDLPLQIWIGLIIALGAVGVMVWRRAARRPQPVLGGAS